MAKILYIQDKINNYAGIERILTCKMNYISEHSPHQVFLTTYEQKNAKIPFPLNKAIVYQPIDVPMPQRNKMTFLHWVLAYHKTRYHFRRQLQSLLKNICPDIVICTAYSYQVLDIIIKNCNKLETKTIMESHTKGDTVTLAYKFQYNRALHKIISMWDCHIMKSLNSCNCIVTLTKQDVLFWKRYARHIEVIPNMLTIVPKNVINYETKRVVSAGRYMPEKGFDRLLDAWHCLSSDFNDWHLYIFGNGDREPYQQIINRHQIGNNVHLMPATNDIAKEFAKSSIYVMSSRYEGFGLVLAEAMSCGLPCISFDCPYGPHEIISDGEDGYLAENGNIKELVQKIECLMSDAKLREAMGMKAIANIARYEPDVIMNKWMNLFQSL